MQLHFKGLTHIYTEDIIYPQPTGVKLPDGDMVAGPLKTPSLVDLNIFLAAVKFSNN